MRSALSNLLIAAAMAVIVTGVLVITTGPVTTERDDGIRIETTAGAVASPVPAQSDDDDPKTPSYLDPEPPAEGQPVDAQVLGVTQAQESDETLADTGPTAVEMGAIIAFGLIALGATAARAGRDHAKGRLTLLP